MRYYQQNINIDIGPTPITREKNLLASTFGLMFLGLLLTAGIAFGVGLLFQNWLYNDVETAYNTLLFTLIASAIGLIILSIVMHSVFLKGKHSLVVPSILYVSLMGILLSTLVIVDIPFEIISFAFGITSLSFGLMALVAIFARGRLNSLLVIGIGAIFGCSIIFLFTYLYSLFTGTDFSSLYLILELVIFGAMILLTIYDIKRIKDISANGQYSTNLALYCAITIYTDFIYIFTRILSFLLRVYARNK